MRQFLQAVCFLVLLGVALPQNMQAQCPMCKISAETNLNNGGTFGKGLNKGILYLFATPYLIIGGIGYVWYRNRSKEEEEDLLEEGSFASLN